MTSISILLFKCSAGIKTKTHLSLLNMLSWKNNASNYENSYIWCHASLIVFTNLLCTGILCNKNNKRWLVLAFHCFEAHLVEKARKHLSLLLKVISQEASNHKTSHVQHHTSLTIFFANLLCTWILPIFCVFIRNNTYWWSSGHNRLCLTFLKDNGQVSSDAPMSAP